MAAAAVAWAAACGDAGQDIAGPPPVQNRGPQAVGTIPAQSVAAGETAAVDASSYFSDPDGDALSYAAVSSNADVAGVSVSGSSVLVTAVARGGVTITVTARDPRGLLAQQRFQVTVPNQGPEAVGEIPAQTVSVGETGRVDVSSYFGDPDGDTLSYTAASSNTGVATVSASGSSVAVAALAKGAVTVTVTARDPQGLAAQHRFQVVVPNRGPEAVGTLPSRTLLAGETETVVASSYFSDPDGDALKYTALSSNAGAVTVSVSGDSVAVTALAQGVAMVTVTASDPDGVEAEQQFRVTVPNRGPQAVGEIPAQTVTAGETAAVDMSPYFTDPDGDRLSYAAVSSNARVAGAQVSGDSVVVTAFARGVVIVTVTARDPQGLAAQQRFGVTVPNRGPETAGEIPAQSLSAGETATVDVSLYFSDPEGDELSYEATSADAGVAEVSVTGSAVVVTALAEGVVTVTVTASDPAGSSVASPFEVTVLGPPPDPFKIELVFVSSVTRTQRAAFVRAAERWMEILAPTELPDLRMYRTLTCGEDPRFARFVETIDDLIIMAAIDEIDGPGGMLAQSNWCWARRGTLFPFYGRMEFDAADIDRLARQGSLEETILHEMGHVVGIGTTWDRLGLIRNPASDAESPDTHFTGPLAIEAFNEAGGTGYRGAKVPVENMGGPAARNAHWREAVLVHELMTGYLNIGGSNPLSAITIQSLADIGYEVDVTLAEPYRLPSADAARAIEAAPRIPYGDDIWRGPRVLADPDGRIVRVIPGPDGDDRRRY